MGFDLSNKSDGYQRFSGAGWGLALTLAKHYGWQAAGTPRPADWDDTDGPWEGEYAIQAGQWVTEADAMAFAEALDRAVAADDFVVIAQRSVDELNAELVRAIPSAEDDIQPLPKEEAEKFRGRMIELAKFARQGAFAIE